MARHKPAHVRRSALPIAAVGVFIAAALVCGVRLGSLGLTEPDEGRYAAVGRAMWESRDFVTPRFNGFVYLDKPPLLHWLTALSIGLLGPREFAVRLSSLLSAAAGVAVVYAFARQVLGRQAGVASAAILCSSLMWFAVGRVIRYDMLLTLAVTAAIWWAWRGFEAEREGRAYFYWAALVAGLGVLAKGPVALALPVLVILLYLAFTGRLRALMEVPWAGVIGILVVVIVPWFALCERANPGAIRFFLLHENLARVSGEIDETHHQPWWYFGPIFLGACLPWTLFLPGAIADGLGGWRHGEPHQRRASVLWLIWLIAPVAAFSLCKVKVPTYILPSLPAAALLTGRYVSPPRRKGRWAAVATGLSFCGAGAVAIFSQYQPPLAIPLSAIGAVLGIGGLAAISAVALGARRWALAAISMCAVSVYYLAFWKLDSDPRFPSDRDLARRVAEIRKPGERLFAVRKLSRGSVFYLNERVAVLGNVPSEYDFPSNRARLTEWVYPLDHASRVLSSRTPAIIICRRRFLDEFRAIAGDRVTVVEETPRILLLRTRTGSSLGQAGNLYR